MCTQFRRLGIVSLSLLMTAACSQLPPPSTYPVEFQRKMVSVNHWGQFAKALEERIGPDLKANGDGSVCIVEPGMKTPFNQALDNYLSASFVQAGFRVAPCDGASPAIKIATQLVRYRSDRGSLTSGWLTTGLSFGEQLAGFSTPVTKAELIVTTSLQRMGTVTRMDADGFYVDDEDWRLYEPEGLFAQPTRAAAARPLLIKPAVVE